MIKKVNFVFMFIMALGAYNAFSSQMDDDIASNIALTKKKSNMLLTQRLSNTEIAKYDKKINNFILKIIIHNNNVETFYKIICSDLKFYFIANLEYILNNSDNVQKKTITSNLFRLHQLLINNKQFSEDELLQNLLLKNIDDENKYDFGIKNTIKKNILSGSLSPIFSEIFYLYEDEEIKKYFDNCIYSFNDQAINDLILYQLSIIAIKARHGDEKSLKILTEMLHKIDKNGYNNIYIKNIPRLLCYTNNIDAVVAMLKIYEKQDYRPNKENSLYNNCAKSLNLFISNFPNANDLLGITGDKVKENEYQLWIRNNKKYSINNVKISKNKDLIKDTIKVTIKVYQTRLFNKNK